MVLCNVPFRPKGPKKYIVPTMLNMFLLGPLSTRSHGTSKSCPLDLLGYLVTYLSHLNFCFPVQWINQAHQAPCTTAPSNSGSASARAMASQAIRWKPSSRCQRRSRPALLNWEDMRKNVQSEVQSEVQNGSKWFKMVQNLQKWSKANGMGKVRKVVWSLVKSCGSKSCWCFLMETSSREPHGWPAC